MDEDTVVGDALGAAALADTPRAAVEAFLRHMEAHYIGDLYTEQALSHLLSMVQAAPV